MLLTVGPTCSGIDVRLLEDPKLKTRTTLVVQLPGNGFLTWKYISMLWGKEADLEK